MLHKLLCIVLLVGCVACVHKPATTTSTPATTLEQHARDISAALQGAIVAAQTEWVDSCKIKPSQNECMIINGAVFGQNALITSIDAYCDWNPRNPPADPAAKCVPVATAEAGLVSAIGNAQQFVNELKGVLGK